MVSQRAQNLAPSATLAITAAAARLRQAGRSIIGLGAGQPDFDTPEVVKQAAIAALNSGQTGYVASQGLESLRDAAAAWVNGHHGLGLGPQNVLVTAGAKMAIALACQALVDPGDEVIIVSPYWVSYPALIELAGGVVRVVQARAEDGFQLPVDEILATAGPKTRALILNSPCNPTGAVADAKVLARLARNLTSRGIYLISDEIYGHLTFEGSLGFAGEEGVDPEYVVVIDGCSKGWAMTGWRIGFVATSSLPLISAINRLQGQSVTCATSFAQHGAVKALELGDSLIAPMREEFRVRRDLVSEALAAMPGVAIVRPAGAFYAFPRVEASLTGSFEGEPVNSSQQFCRLLLEQKGVATVPGSAFGCEGHLRISFAASREDLREGLARMSALIGELSDG